LRHSAPVPGPMMNVDPVGSAANHECYFHVALREGCAKVHCHDQIID